MKQMKLLTQFIFDSQAQGYTTAQIKEALLEQKWPLVLIEQALIEVETEKENLPFLLKPDFWSQPTWPVVDSWAQRNKRKMTSKIKKTMTDAKLAPFVTRAPNFLKTKSKTLALRQSEVVLLDTQKIVQKFFLPKEVLLQKTRPRKNVKINKWQEQVKERQKLEERMLLIQAKTLGLSLMLFFVIIFALYWRKFVIEY